MGDSRYQKSKIYKIFCLDPSVTDTYVGSTLNLQKRKSYHKYSCNTNNSNQYLYRFIRDNGGFDNWEFELLETFPCWGRCQLLIRENYWWNKIQPTLNINTPGLLATLGGDDSKLRCLRYKQAKERDPERVSAMNKAKARRYREAHPVRVRESKSKTYLCECGSKCWSSNKARHEATLKHQMYLLSLDGSDVAPAITLGIGRDHHEDCTSA